MRHQLLALESYTVPNLYIPGSHVSIYSRPSVDLPPCWQTEMADHRPKEPLPAHNVIAQGRCQLRVPWGVPCGNSAIHAPPFAAPRGSVQTNPSGFCSLSWGRCTSLPALPFLTSS